MYFITGNRDKAREVSHAIGQTLEVKDLELDEIQSLDIEEVARKKAEAAFEIVQEALIIDDTGLYIDAWNGFPGPFVKHIIKAGKAELLLHMLESSHVRSATAKAVIAYCDGTQTKTFVGTVEGTIAHEAKGDNGFGWDPIFIPKGANQTFAVMTFAEKMEVSHRARAVALLKEFLSSQ